MVEGAVEVVRPDHAHHNHYKSHRHARQVPVEVSRKPPRNRRGLCLTEPNRRTIRETNPQIRQGHHVAWLARPHVLLGIRKLRAQSQHPWARAQLPRAEACPQPWTIAPTVHQFGPQPRAQIGEMTSQVASVLAET